jgi:hypothetical protein
LKAAAAAVSATIAGELVATGSPYFGIPAKYRIRLAFAGIGPVVSVLGVNAVVNAIDRRALRWRPLARHEA